jgi:L-ribulose-5-phosphate 3-epimerase
VRISLASKVVSDRSPEEVIRIAGALGYGGVEWFCLPQHLPPETTAARADDLAARTRDAGLATVCLSTYVGGFVEADDAECARQLTLLDRYLDLAARLDCPILRVWPDMLGRTLREPVPADALARAADWVGRAADRAARAGRTLGMEMHLTIGADADLLLGLLDAIGRPNVGAIYDPGNLHLARRPYGPETIAGLADRIVHVQLKDASLSRPTPAHLVDEPTLRFGGDFDLLTGQGEIDFVPLFRAFDQVGYRGWYSVECHAQPRPGLDSAAIAAAEIETLRRLRAAAVGVG